MTGNPTIQDADGVGGGGAPWNEVKRSGRGERGYVGYGGRGGRGSHTGRSKIPAETTQQKVTFANPESQNTNNGTLMEKHQESENGQEGVKFMETDKDNTAKKRSYVPGTDDIPEKPKTTVALDFTDKDPTPTSKYAHLTKDEQKAMIKDRGEAMVEKTTTLETLVKIEFNLAASTTQFSVRHSALAVFKLMKDIDPTLTLRSVQDNITQWDDINKLPSDAAFGTHFNVREDASRSGSKKIVVHTKIISKIRLNEIKYNEKIISYLKNNNIYMKADRFEMRKLASPGFFIDLHPRLTNLPEFQRDLTHRMQTTRVKDSKVIDEWREMNNVKTNTTNSTDSIEMITEKLNHIVPEFYLHTGQRSFGGGENRVQTDCLIIQCAESDAQYMKSLLSSIYENINDKFAQGMFVPAGIHLIESPAVLCSLLRRHNKYLQQTTAIPIFGLKVEAFDAVVTLDSGEIMDISEYISRFLPCIEKFEQTNKTESEGKWFILTKKTQVNDVYEFIDKTFKRLFEQFVSPDDLFPGTQYPSRATQATTVRASPTVGTYAAVLRAYSNPQDDGDTEDAANVQFNQAPERPRKRQATKLHFDNSTFPAMEENNNQDNKQQASSVTTATSLTNHSQALNNSFDQKLAELEARLQAQITNIQKTQATQMSTILEHFENHVKTNNETNEANMKTNAENLKNILDTHMKTANDTLEKTNATNAVIMKNTQEEHSRSMMENLRNMILTEFRTQPNTSSHVGLQNTNMSSKSSHVDKTMEDEARF